LAIGRGAIPDLLRPGLAAIEGGRRMAENRRIETKRLLGDTEGATPARGMMADEYAEPRRPRPAGPFSPLPSESEEAKMTRKRGGRAPRKHLGLMLIIAGPHKPPGEEGEEAPPLPKRRRGGHCEGGAARERLDRRARGGGIHEMRHGHLTTEAREKMPKSDFALPGKVSKGPRGGRHTHGAYPIPDESHARTALARVAQHGTPEEKAEVRAKVHRKFPDIGKD
jgi:hypothetical protein